MFLMFFLTHFTLKNSREDQFLTRDTEKYLPIFSTKPLKPSDLRSIKDCLHFNRSTPLKVQDGQILNLEYDVLNTANHEGPCKIQLFEKETLAADLGVIQNCAKDIKFQVKLPDPIPCSSCVLKVTVTANQMQNYPEIYDSCLDLEVTC